MGTIRRYGNNQMGMNTSLISKAYQMEKSSSFDMIYLLPGHWKREDSRFQQIIHCCAQERRVFLIEQPCFTHNPASLLLNHSQAQLWIVTPTLPKGILAWEAITMQQQMVDCLLAVYQIEHYLLWYTQPEALAFTDHLEPLGIIYDSIDAPIATPDLNSNLLTYADMVLLSKESLNEMNHHHQKLVPLLSLPIGIETVAPAWMLLEPPPSSEDRSLYWEKVWGTINSVLNEIVTERSDWPSYSLNS